MAGAAGSAASPASARRPGRSIGRSVGGLMLVVALAIVFGPRSSSGSSSTWSIADSGLAAWDRAVAEWGSRQRHVVVDQRPRRAHRSRRHRLPRRDLRRGRRLRLRPSPQRSTSPCSCSSSSPAWCDQQRAQVDRRSRAARRDAPRRHVRLVVPVRPLGRGRGGVVRPGARRRPPLAAAGPGCGGRRRRRSSRSPWPRPAPCSACTGSPTSSPVSLVGWGWFLLTRSCSAGASAPRRAGSPAAAGSVADAMISPPRRRGRPRATARYTSAATGVLGGHGEHRAAVVVGLGPLEHHPGLAPAEARRGTCGWRRTGRPRRPIASGRAVAPTDASQHPADELAGARQTEPDHPPLARGAARCGSAS